MKVAIMQPYIFPYIGYFQLINAVDTFVFYGDVNFKKRGFINRNYLLINREKYRFTIPCKGISQNKKINEIRIETEEGTYNSLLKSIEYNYKNAPFFEPTMTLINTCFNSIQPDQTIANFAIKSIRLVADYLNIKTTFKLSSLDHAKSMDFERDRRLIDITKEEGGRVYVNSIGGQDLYSKVNFKEQDVDLYFLRSESIEYRQFNHDFVPNLSIIDVLMFNSKEDIQDLLNAYTLQ